MQTVAENSAKISLNWTSITLRLPKLKYLLLNLTAVANHLVRYKLAEYDVFEYMQSATGATYFIPPKDSACLFVQYDVLFEEINRNL
jgi:hypothetical protein